MYRTRAARKDCTENFVSHTLSRKRTRWPPFLHFIAGLNYSANLSSVRFNSTSFCSVYSLWSCFTVHNNRNISFRLVQTKKHCCGNIAALLVLHYIVEISHNLLGKYNIFEQIMSVHFELYVLSGVNRLERVVVRTKSSCCLRRVQQGLKLNGTFQPTLFLFL